MAALSHRRKDGLQGSLTTLAPMKAANQRPQSLDAEAFAREAGQLEGARKVAEFERLAACTVPAAGTPGDIAWQARGELRAVRGGKPEIWLHLAAQGAVDLECQRCLEPVHWPLAIERPIQFVAGDEAAEALDAQSEHDVLPLARRVDLFEVLEDELLLALPLIARHEACPVAVNLGADEAVPPGDDPAAEPEVPHPFAALAALKREPGGH
jgi:uncharacterized protein